MGKVAKTRRGNGSRGSEAAEAGRCPDQPKPKKKKRKKDLEELRRNALEARRKLRKRAAPLKSRKSGFTKALSKFADQRQENEEKTQGKTRGKRVTKKSICRKLLPEPTAKHLVGIYERGAMGDEIRLQTTILSQSNKARLNDDILKLISKADSEDKKSVDDVFDGKKSSEECDQVDDPPPRFPINKVSPVFGQAINNWKSIAVDKKRQSESPLASDVQKKLRETILPKSNARVDVPKENKCRRKLFDDDGDKFPSLDSSAVDEIRFSPGVSSGSALDTITEESPNNSTHLEEQDDEKKRGPEFQNIGWAPTVRYEDLCATICKENFEDCRYDFPHSDPVNNAKRALLGVYADSYRHNLLCKKSRTAARNIQEKPYGRYESSDCEEVDFEVQACTRGITDELDDVCTLTSSMLHTTDAKRSPAGKAKENDLMSSLRVNIDEEHTFGEKASTTSADVEEVTDRRKRKRTSKNKFNKCAFVYDGSCEGSPGVGRSLENLEAARDGHLSMELDPLTLRFLDDVKKKMDDNERKSVFPKEVLPSPPPERNPTKRYLGDPLRRHLVNHQVPSSSRANEKAELFIEEASLDMHRRRRMPKSLAMKSSKRHLPAILRRSGNRGFSRKAAVSDPVEHFFNDELEHSAASVNVNEVRDVDVERNQITKERETSSVNLQTPSVINEIFRRNNPALKSKVHFMKAKYRVNTRSAHNSANALELIKKIRSDPTSGFLNLLNSPSSRNRFSNSSEIEDIRLNNFQNDSRNLFSRNNSNRQNHSSRTSYESGESSDRRSSKENFSIDFGNVTNTTHHNELYKLLTRDKDKHQDRESSRQPKEPAAHVRFQDHAPQNRPKNPRRSTMNYVHQQTFQTSPIENIPTPQIVRDADLSRENVLIPNGVHKSYQRVPESKPSSISNFLENETKVDLVSAKKPQVHVVTFEPKQDGHLQATRNPTYQQQHNQHQPQNNHQVQPNLNHQNFIQSHSSYMPQHYRNTCLQPPHSSHQKGPSGHNATVKVEEEQNVRRYPVYISAGGRHGVGQNVQTRRMNVDEHQGPSHGHEQRHMFVQASQPKVHKQFVNVTDMRHEGANVSGIAFQTCQGSTSHYGQATSAIYENEVHQERNLPAGGQFIPQNSGQNLRYTENFCQGVPNEVTNAGGKSAMFHEGPPGRKLADDVTQWVKQNCTVVPKEFPFGSDGNCSRTAQDLGNQSQGRMQYVESMPDQGNAFPMKIQLADGRVGIFIPKGCAIQNVAQQQASESKCNVIIPENGSTEKFGFSVPYPQAGCNWNQMYNGADTYQ
ncbi:uncharacterized protein LOC105700648 isoform X2 [Orussus abietinus]|uniref:uncharacterized protein LOC105700648 isoform X2 n=1 Tax=Orussus abietinus TaxID=222816 RepID=UPI000C715C9C|nr:uncharacterized protein LOC105700648 isoform X2 [Orussus abietinus]